MARKQFEISGKNYNDIVVDMLAENNVEALDYLRSAFEAYQQDYNHGAMLTALKHVVKAFGGITALAKKTGINRQYLYRALSANGNPSIALFMKIAKALGLKLALVDV